MKYFYFLLLIFTNSLFAQTTIDNLLSPAFPTSLVASADGSTIAWVFNNKGSRNIFKPTEIISATGNKSPITPVMMVLKSTALLLHPTVIKLFL